MCYFEWISDPFTVHTQEVIRQLIIWKKRNLELQWYLCNNAIFDPHFPYTLVRIIDLQTMRKYLLREYLTKRKREENDAQRTNKKQQKDGEGPKRQESKTWRRKRGLCRGAIPKEIRSGHSLRKLILIIDSDTDAFWKIPQRERPVGVSKLTRPD